MNTDPHNLMNPLREKFPYFIRHEKLYRMIHLQLMKKWFQYFGKHTIFRHDNFIGCFSADKIKKSVRKYFCFNIPVYKNMAEEPSCRSYYHEEYIQTSASGNPEDLCH